MVVDLDVHPLWTPPAGGAEPMNPEPTDDQIRADVGRVLQLGPFASAGPLARRPALLPFTAAALGVDESKARLRDQLRAARADADWSRRILSANRIASAILVSTLETELREAYRHANDALRQRDSAEEETRQLAADLTECREAYRRELASNGELRNKLAGEREAFMAGVRWARDRVRASVGQIDPALANCYGLTDETVQEAIATERDIPF